MPSMSSHMAVASKICEKLNVNKDNFIKGNLLPDLYDDKTISHFKIQGKKYMIPDIELASNELDLSNDMYLGYLCHLILDKYYFEEYINKYEFDVFEDERIYDDYDVLNTIIINHFNLDVDYIKKIMNDFPDDINNRKLFVNINCLNKNVDSKLKIVDKDEFIDFLEKTIPKIEEDINKIINQKNLNYIDNKII